MPIEHEILIRFVICMEVRLEDSEKVGLWRQRYFEAQAAAEEFILGRHGQEGLNNWIDANSDITARLLRAQKPDWQSEIEHFMTRLLKQLQLYDSNIELTSLKDAFVLANTECGILRYRREAQQKGVTLTFKSPCDYCVSLNSSIAEKYTGRKVISIRTDVGCTWSANLA